MSVCEAQPGVCLALTAASRGLHHLCLTDVTFPRKKTRRARGEAWKSNPTNTWVFPSEPRGSRPSATGAAEDQRVFTEAMLARTLQDKGETTFSCQEQPLIPHSEIFTPTRRNATETRKKKSGSGIYLVPIGGP